MRSRRPCLVLSLFVLLVSSRIARAEGSAEFDTADVPLTHLANDQALAQSTVLYVDISSGTGEQICWRGTGSLVVSRPNTGASIGSLNNNQCVDAVNGLDGAYGVDMQTDQVIGTAWDIRVCPKGMNANTCFTGTANERIGRLWSYDWNFQQNTQYLDDYAINGSVFAIVPGGAASRDAVIEMQMRGVSGARYHLFANGIGPENDTAPFARVGRSVPVAGHRVTPSLPLYLNLPAKALYNWLAPQITNVALTPNCGGGIVQDRAPGTISFNANVTGQYVVICDVDKNSVYDFAGQTDFSSFGAAIPGKNSVTWNGKNNAGTNAAAGSYSCIVRLNVGEFHYVAEDIETSYPGIRMFRIEADKTTRTGIRMFWDDTLVPVDNENMPNNQRSPSSPIAAGLDPGAYATAASAFYYTGGNTSLPQGNARAWGNYDADGKGNDTFLDQFAAADTAISAPFTIALLASTADADNDGLTNARECDLGSLIDDVDSDHDGVNDGIEASASSAPNTDNDGPIDILDPDSDNDGVNDGSDADRLNPNVCRDVDGDQCDDCINTGGNHSGGSTASDGTDTDSDGACNTGDADDDNDGVPDAMDGAPLNPAACHDMDGDGCDDCAITGANQSGGNVAGDGMDLDGDGLCDDGSPVTGGGDPDDDNDGVPDAMDSAPLDPNRCRDQDADGCDDCAITGANQSGGDPANDGPDPDGDGMCNAAAGGDSDDDGVPDAQDLDRDNDGIPNTAEGDGDLDGDGTPNALDLDSDGDGVNDIVEAGGRELDTDGDGRIDTLRDTMPHDGYHDPLQQSGGALPLPDTDHDGKPDFLDSDDDGDRLSTRDERPGDESVDTDHDGTPDYLDADDDDDHIPSTDELDEDGKPRDTDDDGKPDHLDADDDNDGLPNVDERNDDGSDRDTDGDGKPDYLDPDDDDDGVPTRDELDAHGKPKDTDHDGKPDHLDADDDGDGVPTSDELDDDGDPRDSDGDGKPDHLDADDDGDGIPTEDEPEDHDGDGTPDRLEPNGTLAGGAMCSVQHTGTRSELGVPLLLLALTAVRVVRRRRRRQQRVRRGRHWLLLVATAGLLASRERASAQVALDQFRPAPLASDGFGVGRPTVLPHLTVGAVLEVDYANDPLVYERTAGDPDSEEKIVEHDLVLHGIVALGLWDRLALFVGMPVHLIMQGDSTLTVPAPPADGAGIGDLLIGGRIRIAGDDTTLAALAADLTARLPTADTADRDQSYRGDQIGSYEPALVFEIHAGRFDARARAAVRLREQVTVGNLELGQELGYGVGARLRIGRPLYLHAEFYGSTYLNEAFAREQSPAEALLGAKLDFDGWIIGAAGGPGLLRGYGSPDVRVVGMLGYAAPHRVVPPVVDTDLDGLFDPQDACPREPEDKDQFEDADGCPDPDNDRDGVLDVTDKCPNEPEDRDNFEDEDGCPDPDNDRDGVLDVNDRCPLEAEDTDDFEDQDGCPDPDNDKDRIADGADACPDQPEDFDGFEDQDGCPEEGEGLVKLTCEKIEIKESVYFDSGRDRIQERSFTLLNQVAAMLLQATQIKQLRVEGHTDDRGKDAYNLELSQRRAAAVLRYLLERGIAKERLVSEGYGETKPIADNKTAAGRSQNRRVEFVVVDSEGCP